METKALGRDQLCLVPRVTPSYPLNLLGPLFSLARQGIGLENLFPLCKSCPGQVRGRLEGPAPGCLDGRHREPQSALVQVAHLSPPAPSPGTNSSEAQSRDPCSLTPSFGSFRQPGGSPTPPLVRLLKALSPAGPQAACWAPHPVSRWGEPACPGTTHPQVRGLLSADWKHP